ncbi:hypothetical protein HPB49_015558 [Dermacentor silvarum]|uniref:Uncharacterized protein n=1 Tax=Dermacentor silvarum TaxID=543639 RepID=A0ACB8C498_DERSI|nr:hypothetical protein HPB49_015558 [Dermacentor silvarum]
MKDHEKTMTLMIDEIHIKPYFDYKGGRIVGTAAHSTEPATTAQVFMVQSLLSPNKDVINILPVCKMNAETLHERAKNIIINIEKMGLKVIAVVTDNNALNRKIMSFFAPNSQVSIVYPHQADNARQLAGAQYHISVRQLYECEKKLRLQKVLTFPREETEFGDVSENLADFNFSVAVNDDDIAGCQHDMDAIVYIAGYAAHAASKKLSCSACFCTLVMENREIQVENSAMIVNLTRGGLKFPQHVSSTWFW